MAAFAPAILLMAGCASAPQPTAGDQANLAACTQQADAVYQSQNSNLAGRTSQNGLYFSPMPSQVFQGQQMGALNARNNQITDCVENGNTSNTALPGPPPPAPQIIGTP